MTGPTPPPAWRLPEGVDPGLWAYAHTPRLAAEEDDYFAGHPLFRADAAALDARFVEPGRLVDLGSGAGRHAIRFAAREFSVVAVDLSAAMLATVAAKAARDGLAVDCVQANLCRLGCLADGSFRYALSMFSTIGMIRGRPAETGRPWLEACPDLEAGRPARLARSQCSGSTSATRKAGLLVDESGVADITPGRPDAGRSPKMTYRGDHRVWRFTSSPGENSPAELRARPGSGLTRSYRSTPFDARPIRLPRGSGQGLRAGGWIVFASQPTSD